MHTTYNTGTATYTIYSSNPTTKLSYITNKTCYTVR